MDKGIKIYFILLYVSCTILDKRSIWFKHAEFKEEEEEEEEADARNDKALHAEDASSLRLTSLPSFGHNISICYDPFLVPLDLEDEEEEEEEEDFI